MKKQAVENKIRELVPELMELSFGCVLKHKIDGKEKPIGHVSQRWYDRSEKGFYVGNSLVDMNLYEIIGHPIQLDALAKCLSKEDIIGLLDVWEPMRPLREQSDTVISYLHDRLPNMDTP